LNILIGHLAGVLPIFVVYSFTTTTTTNLYPMLFLLTA
jgi:hypothetical protein